jgi:hypothetical protein
MTTQQRLSKLKKAYGAANIVIAEAFVSVLKIKKSDKLYAAAVEWAAVRLDSDEDILSPKDSKEFAKDNKENKVGRIHKKIIKEIEHLYKINEVLEGIKPVTSTKIDEIVSSRPLPTPDPTKVLKPEVTLESSIKRVEKGGSVTLTWTTKNATKIKRTNIPGLTTKSPLNGSIEVKDIRRRRDFYIIVENSNGETEEAKVRTYVETQEYKKKKERGIIDDEVESDDNQQFLPPKISSAVKLNIISPTFTPDSEKGQIQNAKSPILPQNNSLNGNILKSIDKALSSILKILNTNLKLNQNIFDRDRKKSEAELRSKKEERMEERGPSGIDMMQKGAEKMLSPFKSIIDKIVNFLFYTLLGKVFTEIMTWMNDPKNKDKVDAIGRFLKDFWPLIAGAAVLFLTPLGGFIIGFVQFLGGTIKTLKALKGLVDRLIFKKGAKPGAPKVGGTKPRITTSGGREAGKPGGFKNPFRQGPKITGDVQSKGFKLPKVGLGSAASSVGGFGVGLLGSLAIDYFGDASQTNMTKSIAENIKKLPPEERKKRIEEYKKIIKKEESYQKSPLFAIDKTISLGGETESERQTRFVRSILENLGESNTYTTGGNIFSGMVKNTDGVKVSGAGKDTQAFPVLGGGVAVLQPGEIVLNKKGVENAFKLGINPLELNTGPNANKPVNIKTGIKAMASGGVIGSTNTNISSVTNLVLNGSNSLTSSLLNNSKSSNNSLTNNYSSLLNNSKSSNNSLTNNYSSLLNNSNSFTNNTLIASTPKPKQNTSKAQANPKISNSDFYTLLAIAALEDDKPQGRADVAQTLYNRILAANKYNVNFNQNNNSLKSLIIADQQYEPTFDNKPDWANIKDRNTAAIAIMQSKKGKKYKWDMKQALDQLKQTEAAIKNPKLQLNAQKHVQGRAYFLGTSQHDNMKPGDVLRDEKSNFFSHWYLENTPYTKERGTIAAPIPEMILPKKQNKPQSQPQKKQNILQRITQPIFNFMGNFNKKKAGGLITKNSGQQISQAQDPIMMRAEAGEYVIPKIATERVGLKVLDAIASIDPNSKIRRPEINLNSPKPLSKSSYGVAPITLPPITQGMTQMGSAPGSGTPIPVFSAISSSGMGVRAALADIYGIVG